MSENRIIGFTNPNHFFPMYLVVIYVNGSRVFSRYPSGRGCPISDITEDEFMHRDERIPVGKKTILGDSEIAFAMSKDEIYVGSVGKILEIIKWTLDSGRFKDNEEITEVLERLLAAG